MSPETPGLECPDTKSEVSEYIYPESPSNCSPSVNFFESGVSRVSEYFLTND
jgi:hypothetical protein